MNDRQAFERQLRDELARQVGPIPGLDAIEAARSAIGGTSHARTFSGLSSSISIERGFSMSTVLKFAASVAVLALLGGILAVSGVLTPERPAAPGAESDVGLVAVSEWETRGDPSNPLLFGNSLEVAPDGNVWVLDSRGGFQVIAPDGSFVESWGTAGSEPGQLSFAREIDDLYYGDVSFAPDGGFYVAESGNHRVSKFDADRRFVTSWGGKGTEDGQFIDVVSLSVAPNGNVYVMDDERDLIQVFDADGRFLFAFGGAGTEPQNLHDPGPLDIDTDGTVYVADWGNSRIVKYTQDGEYIGTWGHVGDADDPDALYNPHGVEVGPDGRVYVADMRNDRLRVYDRDGHHIATLGGDYGSELFVDKPVGVAVAEDGSVYVMQYNQRAVEKIGLEEVTAPGE